MFLGDAADQLAAKTAAGVAMWRPDWCVGQLRLDGCGADLGLPDMTLEEAAAGGARTLIVGVANRGGVVSDDWMAVLHRALELGFDIASGLHARLNAIPEIADAAARLDRRLFDVRHPTRKFNVANGVKRRGRRLLTVGTDCSVGKMFASLAIEREFNVANGVKRRGRRLLTVGTDCSVGKMFASLAIEREMKVRGMKADFRATGQTGIFIAGDGVSVDAVVADFISGAAEWLSPDNDDDHWDVVEGQGSLFHASYAGVSLGLLHGSQPDALVLCHEPGRPHMRGLPQVAPPGLAECIKANLAAARLTNPAVRFVGMSFNTSKLDAVEAARVCRAAEDEVGLPCVDAWRDGAGRIVDALV
jgi:uncharacterized NAD-dependent epimerase/dehydratase family protein